MLLAQNVVTLIMAAPALIVVFVLLVVALRYVRLSFQAHMSGVPVSVADILGMTFRKCDPRVVVRTLIMAKQAGIELSCGEVERAYLHGADLQKITLALIRAKEENVDITFQQLVDTDLDERGMSPSLDHSG